MAHVFTIYCDQFTVVSQNYALMGPFSGDKACLPPAPNRNHSLLIYLLAWLLLQQELNNLSKLICHFVRVGWPNIGPAAAGPAGPVPTALLQGQG